MKHELKYKSALKLTHSGYWHLNKISHKEICNQSQSFFTKTPTERLRLFLAVILLLTAVSCLTGEIYARGVLAEMTLRDNESSLTLSFHLGEFRCGENSKITLADKWEKWRVDSSGPPVVQVNLAIDKTDDYEVRVSRDSRINLPVNLAENPEQLLELVQLGKPYIFRDVRGISLYISPFVKTGVTWQVITELDIVLTKTGERGENPKRPTDSKLNPYFIDNYKHHFQNYTYRYEDVGEVGSMLVICYDAFVNTMLPYVQWKNQIGIPTQIVPITEIGTDTETLKQYIQDRYDADSTLTFVQLVGDHEQVPSLISGVVQYNGTHDPYYTLVEGDDSYPDLFVGRFSAENIDQLETQITRTLEYEKAVHQGTWLSKASGVCAVNPPYPGDDDEYNWDHLDIIRPSF
jgi:hypothetical protein